MLTRLRAYFSRRSTPSPWSNQEPIREELFSIDRLEEHARSLASAQQVDPNIAVGLSLVSRLDDNSRVLLEAYHKTVAAIEAGRTITRPRNGWSTTTILSKGISGRFIPICHVVTTGSYPN